MAKAIKKAQGGFAADLLKKKAASDTTRMYDREEFINNINKGLKTPNANSSSSKGTKSYKYISQSGDTTAMSKGDFEKRFTKQKSGGSTAKDGKWMQKVSKSIKARGTEGKCTPITKPGCTGKAKALAKTFKRIAAKRKAK